MFTDGADGAMQEFEVQYTFGAWPLQQYLVPMDNGRLQTLALTWDTITKAWYHMAEAVYPDEQVDHPKLAPLDQPGTELEWNVRRLPFNKPEKRL